MPSKTNKKEELNHQKEMKRKIPLPVEELKEVFEDEKSKADNDII